MSHCCGKRASDLTNERERKRERERERGGGGGRTRPQISLHIQMEIAYIKEKHDETNLTRAGGENTTNTCGERLHCRKITKAPLLTP